MNLNYGDVYMVGGGWATRDKRGEGKTFSTAFEAAGGVVEESKPDSRDEKLVTWLKNLSEKPLVREAKEAGFDLSGDEITDAWNELNPD